MPGTPLNLTYPLDSDTVKVAMAKLVTVAQAIQADIEPKIVPAEISVTSQLDMRSYPIVNIGALIMEAANNAAGDGTVGQAVYYLGNWYLVGSLGAVQITDGDHLAAIGFAGIAGDYGGANPARVTYNSSGHTYVFTYNTGVYAQLVAASLNMPTAAGGDVTIVPDATLTGSTNFILPAPAVSGISSLGINTSGAVIKDGTITHNQTISATLTVDTLAVTGNETVAGTLGVTGNETVGGNCIVTGQVFNGTDIEYPQPLAPVAPVSGLTVSPTLGLVSSSGGAITVYIPIDTPVGYTISGFSVGYVKTDATTSTSSLVYLAGASETPVQAFTRSTLGTATVLHTLTSAHTVVTNRRYFLKLTMSTTADATQYLSVNAHFSP